jgi:hypothetical protein
MSHSEDVQFLSRSGNTIHGTLVMAEKDTGRFILFVHGFVGNKDENGLFSEAAEHFARAGINSLRFDLSGHGSSDGDTKDLSLNQEVEDYKSAIEYLLNEHSLGELTVIGFSLGATVALKAADRRVTRYILWSPALYPGKDMVHRYLSDPAIIEQINLKGTFLKSGKEINKDILYEMKKFKVSIYMNRINSAIRIIHGMNDERIDHRSSIRFKKHYSKRKDVDEHFVVGAGHSYKESRSCRDEVFQRTMGWIQSSG